MSKLNISKYFIKLLTNNLLNIKIDSKNYFILKIDIILYIMYFVILLSLLCNI